MSDDFRLSTRTDGIGASAPPASPEALRARAAALLRTRIRELLSRRRTRQVSERGTADGQRRV